MGILKGNKEKLMLDGPENLNRLGAGTELKGAISTQTSMRLDGIVLGDVTCGGKLVVGAKGLITGNVYVKQAEIEGAIQGDLEVTETLILRASARINGNIKTAKLTIEDGAVFNGSCNMSADSEIGALEKKVIHETVEAANSSAEGIVY
jgi:cytoskeletal protein CcmA (bactofilin family)